MAPKASKQQTQQMAAVKDTKKKGLSIQQQYARIIQNEGYFAPWSRANTWSNRIAINNIRKANTPEVYLLAFCCNFRPLSGSEWRGCGCCSDLLMHHQHIHGCRCFKLFLSV